MSNKFLCAAILFDEKSNRKFEEIKKALKKSKVRILGLPLHITLGMYEDVSKEEFIDYMDNFSMNNESFSINFNHIGLFSLDTLFIEPSSSFELLNFYMKFHEKYDNNCTEAGYYYTLKSKCFVPHATAAISSEPENTLNALKIISDSFEPFTAKAASLCLYEFYPVREIKIFNLK